MTIIGVDRTPGKEMWRGTFMDGGPKFCCGRMVHDDDPDDTVTNNQVKDDSNQKNAETDWKNDRIGEWDGHDWAVENGAEEPGAAYVPISQAAVEAAENEDNADGGEDDTQDREPSQNHTPRETRQREPGTTGARSTPRPNAMATITTAHQPDFEHTFGAVTPSIIPTDCNDRQCGLHALTLSMAAQHPELPPPTFEELATIGRNTLAATENFVGHDLAYIIQQWGQQRMPRLNIQFGWLLEGRGPVLYPNAGMPSAQSIVVWVHNDDHLDRASLEGRNTIGLYNHWSGLGHRQG